MVRSLILLYQFIHWRVCRVHTSSETFKFANTSDLQRPEKHTTWFMFTYTVHMYVDLKRVHTYYRIHSNRWFNKHHAFSQSLK